MSIKGSAILFLFFSYRPLRSYTQYIAVRKSNFICALPNNLSCLHCLPAISYHYTDHFYIYIRQSYTGLPLNSFLLRGIHTHLEYVSFYLFSNTRPVHSYYVYVHCFSMHFQQFSTVVTFLSTPSKIPTVCIHSSTILYVSHIRTLNFSISLRRY